MIFAEAQHGHTQGLESRTRDRVLRAISERGPITASALSAEFDVTTAAIRRHLDALLDLELIEVREVASTHRGRGRPAKAYVVSETGHGNLVSDYDDLAAQALRYLVRAAGPSAAGEFARQRFAEVEHRYRPEVEAAGDDPRDRAEALVGALRRDGFAPSFRPVGEQGGPFVGVQLCQGHCPVQHVATEFPEFCDAETEAFSRLLGVHVQRLATLAQGDHVCTTFIPTASVSSAAPRSPKERSSR
ncbi:MULTISPECIES: helix-turn-helix transcriptional regulator [unclassified Janibacter]|uniref:helix-turn-helix transcriptional regulator n=1 Tax=unclassified Janibacter TaxID=2649294 RepID=UPI003D0958D5